MNDTGTMTLGKNLRGRGEAKAEGCESIHQSIRKNPEVTTAAGMDWNPSVSILEGKGEHPDVPPQCTEDRLGGPHLEPCRVNEAAEEQQVYHRPPKACSRPHYKQDGCNSLEKGEPARSSPWKSRTEPPRGKAFPRWRKGNNTEEGAEPLTEEEVMRTGHGSPTSTPPPPKVPPPCPTRWTSGGTDSRLP